jgi:hypothetical protein
VAFHMQWSDRQWASFLTGFIAAQRIRALGGPYYRSDTVLEPVSIGGPNKRAIMVAETPYVGSGNYSVPVYTFNMSFEAPFKSYSGFTTRIDLSDPRLSFIGVSAGEHFDPAVNLVWKLLPGKILVVYGLVEASYINRDTSDSIGYTLDDLQDFGVLAYSTANSRPSGYRESMEVLFSIEVGVSGEVTIDNPIKLPLIYKSGTVTGSDPAQVTTSLVTFLSGAEAKSLSSNIQAQDDWYYLFFVTPLLAVGGAILSDIPAKAGALGPSDPIKIRPSKSCVYAATVLTPPSWPVVMGLYVNASVDDILGGDLQGVKATFRVDNPSNPNQPNSIFQPSTRWEVLSGRGWLIDAASTDYDDRGVRLVQIDAVRDPDAEVVTDLFAYIVAVFQHQDALNVSVTPTLGTLIY